MNDIRQSKEFAKYLSSIGWITKNPSNTIYYLKKIPILGYVLKIQRPTIINFSEIEALKKEHKIFQIIIEPKFNTQVKELSTRGYKTLKEPYLPSKTLLLDITRSKTKLIRGFENDARSAIRKNNKLELINADLNSFYEGWRRASKSRFFLSSQKDLVFLQKAFKNNFLALATLDYSSGAIFLKFEDCVYYWKAFTNKDGRKQKAQYKVVWEGIMWGKKLGAKQMDFEGIFDERFPLPSWKGFTHFKKSFRGVEKLYPGAFVKTFWFRPFSQ